MSRTARRLEVLTELRELLVRQLQLAGEQRRQMARLDGEAVLNSVRVREELRAPTQRLIDELAQGPQSADLRREVAEVRDLLAMLVALDQVNREVAAHGLSAVRGLLHALAPRASAYDRRGRDNGAAVSGSRSTRA